MHLWILTIGSSDAQLMSDKTNQAKGRTEKQRSGKVWSYWYTNELIEECYDISKEFDPKPLFQGQNYRVFPRVLGEIYQASSETVRAEIWSYLTFPLLDDFVQALADYPAPEAITVLLTDQSPIFEGDHQRKPNSPYWQDTCELKPILQKYFAEKFLGVPCEFIFLISNSKAESLDNWNAVLDLMRGKFADLTIADQLIQVNPEENVYVSHQAGTPAISSALQFCSLAKFGDRVKFLVSNEHNSDLTDIVRSSTYLRGIEIQQAKKLLEWHDYSGMKEVLQRHFDEANRLKDEPKPEDEKLKCVAYLLDMAIQWNFAKFEDFAKQLLNYSEDQHLAEQAKAYLENSNQYWWWEAYEAAYLGVVRLKQGNTVEAMFHSFRAVEGLLRRWVDEFYAEEIKQTKHPKWEENERWNKNLNSYGEDLYWFLTLKKSVDQTKDIKQNKTPDIFIFGSRIFKKRNDLFHQLKGLQGKDEVFENWRSPNEPQWKQDPEEKWKMRVLKCLNFISDETFEFLDKESSDGRFASLMVKVHRELEREIADL